MHMARRTTRAAAATLAVTLMTAVAVGSPMSPLSASNQRPAQVAQNPIEELLKQIINDILSGLEDPQPLADTVIDDVSTFATCVGEGHIFDAC